MFKKIENHILQHSEDNWSKYKGDKIVAQYDSGTTCLKYFVMENFNEFRDKYLKNMFITKPTYIFFVELSGNGFLNPHIDHNTLVVLNFYFSASNSETKFYELKKKNLKIKNRNIFKFDEIKEIGYFSAQDRDIYLLDVSKIHSVYKNDQNTRQFISFQWQKNSFNEILKEYS
jgi:hypothetical protein